MIDEGGIKPYVSMSRGEDDGKMMYNVLDRNEKTIFRSRDQEEAQDFLRLNYDKLRAGEMQVASGGVDTVDVDEEALDEYAKTDFESWLQRNYKRDVKDLKAQEYSDMVRKYKMSKEREGQMQKAGILKKEGNQFAQAVQKAKAAGMKAGDKFKVGDQEYTLKDAIELAGLQLEDFYSEEEQMYDNQIDRMKNLAFYQ